MIYDNTILYIMATLSELSLNIYRMGESDGCISINILYCINGEYLLWLVSV
jgi:hypothetical protein